MAEMEALACQRAVQFAIEIGLTQVIVEGDLATEIFHFKRYIKIESETLYITLNLFQAKEIDKM